MAEGGPRGGYLIIPTWDTQLSSVWDIRYPSSGYEVLDGRSKDRKDQRSSGGHRFMREAGGHEDWP